MDTVTGSWSSSLLFPIALVVLLALSAFFSGSETALLGTDWLRIRYLVRKGNRRARTLQALLERKDLLIGTILVGNNVVNIAASAVATAVAVEVFGQRGIAVATAGMTLAVLVFSEITPKTFASRHSEAMALTVAPVFSLLNKLLFPATILVTMVSNGMLHLLGIPRGKLTRTLSEDELRVLLVEGDTARGVEANKRRMLHGIFEIGRQSVREVMIPRPRVRGLEVATPLEEASKVFVESGYTRLPVYRESLDDVLGVAHARDVLACIAEGRQCNLAAIAHEPFFVPESRDLESLLYDFKQRHVHLALVVDEFGGVEGIVTLEDLLEEIVGEIRDEHDVEGETLRFLPGGEALVHGGVSIRDVNQTLGLQLPATPDVTLGGFMMTRLGHIPERSESFSFQGSRFTVERTGRHRVLLVRVTPLDEETAIA